MAFMIPIVKKDYNLYQSGGKETPSPCGSLASRSGNSSLSCSPGFNMDDKYKASKNSSSGNGSWTSSSSSSTSKFAKFNDALAKKLGQTKNPR